MPACSSTLAHEISVLSKRALRGESGLMRDGNGVVVGLQLTLSADFSTVRTYLLWHFVSPEDDPSAVRALTEKELAIVIMAAAAAGYFF